MEVGTRYRGPTTLVPENLFRPGGPDANISHNYNM